MQYRNPKKQERDQRQDAKTENGEFLRLLVVVTGILVGMVALLNWFAVWAAPRIPFSLERKIAQTTHLDEMPVTMLGGKKTPTAQDLAIEATLQSRVDLIARTLNVPPDMQLTAHYVDSEVVNAVATLGGHVTMFRGLLEKLEYQEELDAVLAHEIGHVTERHMVKHLSRGITTAVVLSTVGLRSPTINRWLIGDAQQLTMLSHTREAERESDSVATQASMALYGHTQGITSLFERFLKIASERREKLASSGLGSELEFLQSHPLPQTRLDAAKAQVGQTIKPLTPLPSVLRLGPASASQTSNSNN